MLLDRITYQTGLCAGCKPEPEKVYLKFNMIEYTKHFFKNEDDKYALNIEGASFCRFHTSIYFYEIFRIKS